MINTYKRRTINQRAELHEHEFVTYDDCMEMLQKFFETTTANSKNLSLVDIGLNPHSQPLSHYRSWEMGGMVTLGVGNNAWAGGDNDADGGLTFHLTEASITVDGKKVVSNGNLERAGATASR